MKEAVVIVDELRGFFPATPEFPETEGFGELPLDGAHDIISPSNLVIDFASGNKIPVYDVREFHQDDSPHFADWKKHCVRNTKGASPHPRLQLPENIVVFHKKEPNLGEADLSYSAFFSLESTSQQPMPEYLRDRSIGKLTLLGLAIDHCVGKSALDFARHGFEVSVLSDATKPITEAGGEEMKKLLIANHVSLITSTEFINNQG